MTCLGTYTTPDGKTIATWTANATEASAGKAWTIKDQNGNTIGQANTYYWTPTGPPEIDRTETGVMSFIRVGIGPAAGVIVLSKNLKMFKLEGNIKDVELGDGFKAKGNVPEGSPKVTVHFRASNLEKEGEIDLQEPKPESKKEDKK
jgi:hypothetical protein